MSNVTAGTPGGLNPWSQCPWLSVWICTGQIGKTILSYTVSFLLNPDYTICSVCCIHAVIYLTPLKFLPTVFSSDVQSLISKDLLLIEDTSGRRRYISRNCETWLIDKQGSAARCIFFLKTINALLYFSLIYRRTWRSASPGPTFNPLLTVCPHLSLSSLVPIINSIFTPAPPLCSHSKAQLWDNDSVETSKLSDSQKCATRVWLHHLCH